MGLTMEAYAVSDIGIGRDQNEDTVYFDGSYRNNVMQNTFSDEKTIPAEGWHVFAVMDGMGGMARGEEASFATAMMLDEYKRMHPIFDSAQFLQQANRDLCDLAKKQKVDMGSTAVVLVTENERVCISNIGDSRAYRLRNGILEQLSEDHTVENSICQMQELLGVSLETKSASSHALTQHLGIPEDDFLIEPFVSDWEKVRSGDVYILCSDGVTNGIDERRFAELLGRSNDVKESVDVIVRQIKSRGRTDNISIIAICWR